MTLTRRSVLAGFLGLPLVLPGVIQPELAPWSLRLINAARSQIGVTTSYDPAYVRLAYPMGDVDRSVGVCTDVIVRAYRDAFDVDLQKLVHEDMGAAFSKYPKSWGLTRPDKNIDHRRVPNLERYFERKGYALDTPARLEDWQAGDIHTMRLGGRLPHIAIVSNTFAPGEHRLVIHNIGGGTREEDLLGVYENERRFRFAPV